MSANSTHSIHNGAPETASQTPTTRNLWTLESPFFDSLTMSAIVLDQLQQHIRFQAGPLYYLYGKDKTPGTELSLRSRLLFFTYRLPRIGSVWRYRHASAT